MFSARSASLASASLTENQCEPWRDGERRKPGVTWGNRPSLLLAARCRKCPYDLADFAVWWRALCVTGWTRDGTRKPVQLDQP